MGRAAPAVLQHKTVMCETDPVRLKLTSPASVEGHDFLCPFSHRERDGEAVHLPVPFTEVRQGMTHLQHTGRCQHQFTDHAQTRHCILTGQGE